jgi:hypothetical protein
MTNLKMLKVLNPIMLLTFLAAALGIILYRFPIIASLHEGSLAYEIHTIAGQIFILLAFLHIILNWNWIKLHIFGIKAKAKKAKK